MSPLVGERRVAGGGKGEGGVLSLGHDEADGLLGDDGQGTDGEGGGRAEDGANWVGDAERVLAGVGWLNVLKVER